MPTDEIWLREMIERDKKWQYFILNLSAGVHGLDEMGRAGWELVAVENGLAYLKRRDFRK